MAAAVQAVARPNAPLRSGVKISTATAAMFTTASEHETFSGVMVSFCEKNARRRMWLQK